MAIETQAEGDAWATLNRGRVLEGAVADEDEHGIESPRYARPLHRVRDVRGRGALAIVWASAEF